jgi:hypothetical protein
MSVEYGRHELSALERTWKHKVKTKPNIIPLALCKEAGCRIRQGDECAAEPPDWFPGKDSGCNLTTVDSDRARDEDQYRHAISEIGRLEEAIESPVRLRGKPVIDITQAERERAELMVSLIPMTRATDPKQLDGTTAPARLVERKPREAARPAFADKTELPPSQWGCVVGNAMYEALVKVGLAKHRYIAQPESLRRAA